MRRKRKQLTRRPILKVLGSVIASMASFVAGAVGAFVSVETYAMEKGQGGIKITLEEASWIGKKNLFKFHGYSHPATLIIVFFSDSGVHGLQPRTRGLGLRQFLLGEKAGHVLVRSPRGPVLRGHWIFSRQGSDISRQFHGRVSAVHAIWNSRLVQPGPMALRVSM